MRVIMKGKNPEYVEMYLAFVRQQITKIKVMDDVFAEYTKTILNIDEGNCLASENLKDLQSYFQKNWARYALLCDQLNDVPVPAAYEKVHQRILDALQSYQYSLQACDDAIDVVDNQVCVRIIKKQLTWRQKAKDKMEMTVAKVKELRICL